MAMLPGSGEDYLGSLFESFDTNIEFTDTYQDYIDGLTAMGASYENVFTQVTSFPGVTQQTQDMFFSTSPRDLAQTAITAVGGNLPGMMMGAALAADPYEGFVKGMGPIAQTGSSFLNTVTNTVMDKHVENIMAGNEAAMIDGELVSVSTSNIPGTEITVRSLTGLTDLTMEQFDAAFAVNRDQVHPETGEASLEPAGNGYIDTATGNYVGPDGQISAYGPYGTMEQLAQTNPQAHATAMENRSRNSFAQAFKDFFGIGADDEQPDLQADPGNLEEGQAPEE